MANNSIVKIENLVKRYGDLIAVNDVSFEVYEGEIFGLLGPNGAGKTTTIECIEGLRTPEEGKITILGFDDPIKNSAKLKPKIGIQLQESELQERIKVWEALDFYASIYDKTVDWEKLIEQLGLSQKRNSYFSKLSGGQKQRLFIALGLINDPEVVFLDELTTGLDPQARRNIWELILNIKARGKTVFLTTHFMDEAEKLCDRIAIIDNGKIIALDTPKNLIKTHSPENKVSFSVNGDFDLEKIRVLKSITSFEQHGDHVTLSGEGTKPIVDVVNYLSEHSIEFDDLHTEKSTLEDVFIKLTGKEMRS